MLPVMRSLVRAAFLLTVIAIAGGAVACSDDDGENGPSPSTSATATESAAGTLSLESSAFEDGATIPVKYTCDDEDISPPITIGGVPQNTVALALVVKDTQTTGQVGFTHWVVFNIDPSTTDVPEGTVPGNGIEGQTSQGHPGYFGPCPPSGEALYTFTLYAVDSSLDIGASVPPDAVEAAMAGHIVDQTQLTGVYAR
jgi:Raf kinase inhibitor-like YbhB/YbcL family protein